MGNRHQGKECAGNRRCDRVTQKGSPAIANFNKVIIAGNLTRDPELSYLPGANQTPCTKISIAVNRFWKDKAGQKVEKTAFVECTAFGRQAEAIHQYCSKGSNLLIEGKLDFHSWETPEGQKRSKLSVTIESFEFLGSPRDRKMHKTPYKAPETPPAEDTIPPGEEIPF